MKFFLSIFLLIPFLGKSQTLDSLAFKDSIGGVMLDTISGNLPSPYIKDVTGEVTYFDSTFMFSGAFTKKIHGYRNGERDKEKKYLFQENSTTNTQIKRVSSLLCFIDAPYSKKNKAERKIHLKPELVQRVGFWATKAFKTRDDESDLPSHYSKVFRSWNDLTKPKEVLWTMDYIDVLFASSDGSIVFGSRPLSGVGGSGITGMTIGAPGGVGSVTTASSYVSPRTLNGSHLWYLVVDSLMYESSNLNDPKFRKLVLRTLEVDSVFHEAFKELDSQINTLSIKYPRNNSSQRRKYLSESMSIISNYRKWIMEYYLKQRFVYL